MNSHLEISNKSVIAATADPLSYSAKEFLPELYNLAQAFQIPIPEIPRFAFPFQKEATIIGAGIGGVMSALELAKDGWQVTLLEGAEEVLARTSNATPGRLGLGFHYADPKTAEMMLRTTIDFVRAFPHFLVAQDKSTSHHLRHGRYYITSDSLFTAEAIMSTYEMLKKIYTQLVKEDPCNQIFGPPDQFYHVLYEDEYENVVNPKRVVKGIETWEQLLDWPRFRAFLIEELSRHTKLIKIIPNAMVTSVSRDKHAKYTITYRTPNGVSNLTTPYLVNCTWQNSQIFEAQLGCISPDQINRTNRVKVIATAKLPESLNNLHSTFAIAGPHCMVTNLGNRIAKMTFAPVTNVFNCMDLVLPDHWERLINKRPKYQDLLHIIPELTQENSRKLPAKLKNYLAVTPASARDTNTILKLFFGERIKEGIAEGYIPAMKDAEILSVEFGVVKTLGDVDIYDPNSPVHKRDYPGVMVWSCGFVTNDCMKLVYSLANARLVVQALNNHYLKDLRVLASALYSSQFNEPIFWACRFTARLTAIDPNYVESDPETTPTRNNCKKTSLVKPSQLLQWLKKDLFNPAEEHNEATQPMESDDDSCSHKRTIDFADDNGTPQKKLAGNL